VGFSSGARLDDLISNDFSASEDFLLTMHAFFQRYPERSSNVLYIASESYGGHYMPQVALKVLADPVLSVMFQGMLVGNPYTR
jgi:carboxypeptidase C (cathepsin A)